MIRHYSLAIFRLIIRNLISSYTRFACVVYSEEVKAVVGTRSRIEINYMFRHYSLAIFRLIMRNLIGSYTRFVCVCVYTHTQHKKICRVYIYTRARAHAHTHTHTHTHTHNTKPKSSVTGY